MKKRVMFFSAIPLIGFCLCAASAQIEETYQEGEIRIENTTPHDEDDDLRVPILAEFARLLHDTEQHAKAVPEFRRATAELDQQGIVQEDPIGFADFLTDYARSANEAGNPELSREVEERARNLRERNRDVRAQSEFKRYR